MTPPTFTDAELLALSGSIDRLRDELARSPEWCESNTHGYLIEIDDAALASAKIVIDRLYRFRRWPQLYTDDSYLPAPTLAPDAPTVPCPDCGGYRGGHHAECPRVPAPRPVVSPADRARAASVTRASVERDTERCTAHVGISANGRTVIVHYVAAVKS